MIPNRQGRHGLACCCTYRKLPISRHQCLSNNICTKNNSSLSKIQAKDISHACTADICLKPLLMCVHCNRPNDDAPTDRLVQ